MRCQSLLLFVAAGALLLLATTTTTVQANSLQPEWSPAKLISSVASPHDSAIEYDGANELVVDDTASQPSPDHAVQPTLIQQEEAVASSSPPATTAAASLVETHSDGDSDSDSDSNTADSSQTDINTETQDRVLISAAAEAAGESGSETESETGAENQHQAKLPGFLKGNGKGIFASAVKLGKAAASKVATSLKSGALGAAVKNVARNVLNGNLRLGGGRGGRGRQGAGGRGAHGWGVSPRKPRRVQQRLPSPRFTGAASTLTRANVRCVLCQYITQKLKAQLLSGAPVGGAVKAGAPSPRPVLLETYSFASLGEKSRVESEVAATAYADASAASSALPRVFEHGADASRRFRHTDILGSRAKRARFTQVRNGDPNKPDQAAAREAYLKLYSTVYASFENICAKKMPLAYLPYCNDMLKSYRFFAQGLNYGDRAEQICMNGNFCDHRSYVRRVTHAAYTREPGDA